MQRYGISRSEAKRLVREKRHVANPNSGFYRQLKVWEACKYDIRTVWYVDGVKQFKMEYQEWARGVEEERRRKKVEEEQPGEEAGIGEEGVSR